MTRRVYQNGKRFNLVDDLADRILDALEKLCDDDYHLQSRYNSKTRGLIEVVEKSGMQPGTDVGFVKF